MRIRYGFSLIEVLIVLSLIGFIAALSCSCISITDKNFVRVELEKLSSFVFFLQAHARATQITQTLTFNIARQSYTLGGREYALHPATLFGSIEGIYGPPSRPYCSNQVCSFKNNTIKFYPDGTISAGIICLTDKKRTCFYALTSGVAHVPYIRCYKYQQKWCLL